MKEDPSTTCDGSDEFCDSSSSDNDGNANGSMDASDDIAAKIGIGTSFDGTDDFVSIGECFR